MSKKRSTQQMQSSGVQEQAQPVPPKIVDLLGAGFAEAREEAPPQTVFRTIAALTETPSPPQESATQVEEPGVTKPEALSVLFDERGEEAPAARVEALSENVPLEASVFSPSYPRIRTVLVTALACALIAVGAWWILQYGRTQEKHRVAEAASSRQLPTKDLALPRLKPRFSVPPPPAPESAQTADWGDPAIYVALGRLDLALNAGMNKGDVSAYLRKSGLALFDPRFGLADQELAFLDVPVRKVVEVYRDFFASIGQWPGKQISIGDLVNAAEQFGERAVEARGLETKRVLLCRNATGFGRYEPVLEPTIRSRHLPLVQVYVEFSGAKPEIREDGRYIYRLAQSLRLQPKDRTDTPALIDTTVSLTELSLSVRRDFFSAQYLRADKLVPPGDYVVDIELTDQVSGVRAFGRTWLKVVAD